MNFAQWMALAAVLTAIASCMIVERAMEDLPRSSLLPDEGSKEEHRLLRTFHALFGPVFILFLVVQAVFMATDLTGLADVDTAWKVVSAFAAALLAGALAAKGSRLNIEEALGSKRA